MKFKSKELSKFNDYMLEHVAEDFTDYLTDRLQISKSDLSAIIDCADGSDAIIKKMKIRPNFLYRQEQKTTAREFKQSLISADGISRARIMMDQMVEYKAHRAWQSSHRFSAMDGWSDMLNVFNFYSPVLKDNDDSDWSKIIDLIKQKLTV